MAEPFLSEIRIMSFVFPPKGWALCNGQLLPINQNQALFSLLGTTRRRKIYSSLSLKNLLEPSAVSMGTFRFARAINYLTSLWISGCPTPNT